LNVDDATDQDRFAEVFLPHLVDAFRLARWLAGSRVDAEDIVQEASLRAFKGIRGFGGGDSRAWTLTIVRNTSYRWLAKNRPSALVLAEISIGAPWTASTNLPTPWSAPPRRR
jgi:RNA polymerase sigma factor (sigma-70 family)